MSTPPIASSEGRVHSDLLTSDLVFVPKSEDTGVAFPSLNALSQEPLTSSALHVSGASAILESRHGSSHPGPSVPLQQLDMEGVDSVTGGDPSGGFMNGFALSQQQMQLSNSVNDEMLGITSIREQSPGSVHTPSSNPSHAASPIPPPFSNVSTSSLASALEESGASFMNRSRSGSLASPSATTSYAPRASPPQSTQEPPFKFSLPPEVSAIPRPDPVNAPHMLAVDDVLNSIMRAAASARQACSLGQGVEASTKIDEMKRQIALVSELMSNTGIDSPPGRDSGQGVISGVAAPSSSSGHRHSMSLPRLNSNASTPPGLIPNFPNTGLLSIPSGPSSLEQVVGGSLAMDLSGFTGNHGSPDSDTSRKRCASSMAGNRINKALRLDPSDGNLPSLAQPASPSKISLNIPPLHLPSQGPSVVSSPIASLPNNAQPSLTHSASSGSLSTLVTPINNPVTGPSLSGPPASSSMSTSRPLSPPPGGNAQVTNWQALQKHMSASAPATTLRPGLAQAHAQSSFPLSLIAPASMSLTDTGRRDIDAQLELELTSPTNLSGAWSALSGTTPMQPQLGSGLGTVHPHDLAGGPAISFAAPPFPPPGHAPIPMQTAPPTSMGSNSGLGSRSASFSHPNPHQPLYGMMTDNGSMSSLDQQHVPPEFVPSQAGRARARSRATGQAPRSPSSSSCEDDGDSDYEAAYGYPLRHSKSSPPLRSRPGSPHRRSSAAGSAGSPGEGQNQLGAASGSNDIPPEYRADVDRIFFEFLNNVCSNLDATDVKGELIHQTLMAKKMQRLDESPDFRPFKFRIQAFTNGFLEELARQGFPEEKIAMKKVRNYLWTQPYISRFNEDGKKAKSKGNHIWNIDAKKKVEGGWEFRPFRRKLAGAPPSVAYIGLRWTWIPRIWDPQASRANIQVQYNSPNLPSWLSWRDGQLQGIPPPDAQSCEVTVEARTVQDGREELLAQTFIINVSPVPTGTDMSFTGLRPPLAAELHNPRRVNSDSIVPNAASTIGRPLQALPSQALGQGPNLTTQDAQMMQVLTSAAQRVAQEAQAHVIAATHPHEPPGPELQALAKQQHVLTVTAQALDQEVSVPPEAVPASSHALVAAAQQVVFQAARQVAADRSAVMSLATGVPPAQQPPAGSTVTVNEVSVATQTAVAHAVEITGPLSSEVDVMMTASSLLQQQTRPQPILGGPIEAASLAPPTLDAVRPHSTGTMPPQFSIQQSAIPLYPTATLPLSSLGSIDF